MIVCCGEALVDMVPLSGADPSPYGSFEVCPGGSIYNSAIAAARLGAHVGFLGRVASDFLGDKLFGRLAENGVDTALTIRSGQPVTLAFVERDAHGNARYAFYSNGAADRSIVPGDIPARLPAEAAFLLVGSISLVLEPSASTIRGLVARESSRLLVSFDPNIRASLIPDRDAYVRHFESICADSAIVRASDSDMEWIYGPASPEEHAARILALGPELVVLTLGGEGSAAFGRAAKATAPVVKVKVADTIGAGDTFHAAFLAALDGRGVRTRAALRSLDAQALRGLLEFANAAAAMNCTRKGAEPPALAELETAYPALAGRTRSA